MHAMTSRDDEKDFVEFAHPGGNLVARILVPSIGQAEAPFIREQVLARLGEAAPGRSLVLDLSQVSLVSSLGLGTFVDLRNSAEKAGLRPAVFGMNRHLADLFRLMKIERLFASIKTQQELDALVAE
jgi:anti-anti-sigma factor